MAGYYKKFIKDFAKTAVSLARLTKKILVFAWDGKCMEVFEKLKELLTSAPVLTIPDRTKSFTVHTDTCGTRLRVVLMQEGKVIAYASR